MKGISYDIIPILESSAGYHKKRPDNHTINSHRAWNIFPKLYLTPLIIVEFQQSSAVSFTSTLSCWCEEQDINHACPGYEKMLW